MKQDAMRTGLLEHFDKTRRDLPWRVDRTPYRVLVSEFMLQQTRVDTVLPYYTEWLERFPDFDALADASIDEILKAWEGLGYYSRARNLHRTAVMVRKRFDGALPDNLDQLRELPGVGEYTAGAIASIAFGLPVAAVDGNVRRVLSRLFNLPAPSATELREAATALVDRLRPGDFNEALMELGATICTPRAPKCEVCPVSRHCLALAANTVHLRPEPKKKKPVPSKDFRTWVLLDEEGRALLVRRPSQGLLASLWEFPTEDQVESMGYRSHGLADLPPVRHAFTHLKATYLPQLRRVARAGSRPVRGEDQPGPQLQWSTFAHMEVLAMPRAQRRIQALAEALLRSDEALAIPDQA
ncbi:MAG: A/G-specific adenine glycosylase [Longimicrobiales bacterium]